MANAVNTPILAIDYLKRYTGTTKEKLLVYLWLRKDEYLNREY